MIAWGGIRPYVFFTSAAFILLITVIVKSALSFHHSSERGRLVASVVLEQARSLTKDSVSDQVVESQKGWPDGFLLLESWLVSRPHLAQNPLKTARVLQTMAVNHSFSRVMGVSLDRWADALMRWEDFNHKSFSFSRMPAEELARALLGETRGLYAEASGYRKVGRQYDAAVLYLWSIDLATRFIEQFPRHEQVPEMLFILGDSYIQLKHALPLEMRPDRILNLCSEMYGESIWANQSTVLRKAELENGV